MKAVLIDYRNRLITEQQISNAFDALSLTRIYSNWQYVIVVASNGHACEMFYRL